MSKGLKRIWSIITTLLVIVVILFAVALVGVRLVGFEVFTVLSGSMEHPTVAQQEEFKGMPLEDGIQTGALVYVKKVPYKDIEAGDVITFMLNEDTVATHRVVEVVPDDEEPAVIRFRTKGDNNDSIDAQLVHYKNVIGTPVFSIPYLGYVANYIQNPPGTYIAIAGAAVLLLLVFIPDLLAPEDKNKKGKKGKQAAESEETVSK